MLNDLVSVIIPFYSHVDWLTEAIDSVLAQSYRDYEIIVINDGSAEDVTAFLSLYSNKITYIFKVNGGPASARNVGIEAARGDYIAFLDSDDLWHPQKLEKQINKMKECKAVWSCTNYDTFGTVCKSVRMSCLDGDITTKYCSKYIATPSVIIKGSALKINKDFRFNTDMRYGQDSCMWMLMIEKYDILNIGLPLTKVRIRGTNAGKRAIVQIKARVDLWKFGKKNIRDFANKYSILYKIGILFCKIGVKILNVSNLITQNDNILEIIAKVLYIFPYCMFKINTVIFKNQ